VGLTNHLIELAERRAQQIRPGTLTCPLAGGSVDIPCTLGNLDFFQRITPGGFQPVKTVSIRLLRSDIPAEALAPSFNFQRGKAVVLTNDDQECPAFGEKFNLIIAESNSEQPMVMVLNLERQLA